MVYHPFVTRVVPGMVMRRGGMLPLRGEVLGSTGGRGGAAGVVGGASHGRVLIQSDRRPLELVAHYQGTVINVMSGLGAIIEVRGALIQGIWGSDKAGVGVVKCLVDDPAQDLDPEAMDMSCRGSVLVGGRCPDESSLRRAKAMDVQGLGGGRL